MTKRILPRFLLFVLAGTAAYFAAFHLRLVHRAQAQTRDVGFRFRMASYIDYELPAQKFVEEQEVTLTPEGAVETRYGLPSQRLSHLGVTTLTLENGDYLIGFGPLGIRTRGPRVDQFAAARANAYTQRLVATNCVDYTKGERLIGHDRLLEKWDAIAVAMPDKVIAGIVSRDIRWRVKEFGCYAVQNDNRSEQNGTMRRMFTKLESVEPASPRTQEMLAQFAAMREVKPSELYQQFAQSIGQPACHNCQDRLQKLDDAFAEQLR